MALQQRPLVGSVTTQAANLRAFPYEDGIRPGTLATQVGAPALPNLTPLSRSGDNWTVWADSDPTSEAFTITSNATPATAGDFTLTFEGETTAAIAFDATAAEIKTALELLSNVNVDDLSVAATAEVDLGVASAVVTITADGSQYEGLPVALTADFSGLTGNVHVIANTATGAATTNEIDGLLWQPVGTHASSATEETTIGVFRSGRVHHDDVPVPTGESQSLLTIALKSAVLRQKNIEVSGVAGA